MGRKIGKGDFGTVYEGIYNCQKVAIKIIDKNRIPKIESVYTEIALMSTFNHRNIMKLIGGGENSAETFFILMPLMTSNSFFQLGLKLKN